MNSRNVFTELKRRNVLRAAAFYAASAWLLVQVATQVFPFFHIAEWVVRWIVVAAIIGFPCALVFSWLYEWTPHGLQRESEIAPNESTTRQTGKKLDRWIIAILLAAVVLLLTDRFVFRPNETSTIPEKSIAVLPFENLSDEKGNAYFADGVQDEILTRLAKVADLKVISRTSTQRFKSAPENLPEIARQLGVAHILEGSVQKDAGKVRVNVQLIHAQSDAHLWADTFDR
ncbi:MAG: adenylyl cyclase, partial [Spartobacteria bacterium]